MVNVTMTHPNHGAKVAICDQEVRQDLLNGWVRYEVEKAAKLQIPSFLSPSAVEPEPSIELTVNELTTGRKKRG